MTKNEKETYLALKGWRKIPEHWVKEFSEHTVGDDGSVGYSQGYRHLPLDVAYETEISGRPITYDEEIELY